MNELHTRNYHPTDENVWVPRYYNRELRSKSHYRTLTVPEFLSESKDVKYARCLGPYGKVKTLPTINTRLKKIDFPERSPLYVSCGSHKERKGYQKDYGVSRIYQSIPYSEHLPGDCRNSGITVCNRFHFPEFF